LNDMLTQSFDSNHVMLSRCDATRVVNFPEILAKVWHVIMSIFSFEFADIHGSHAETSYIFLNIMLKVKA